MEDLTTFQRETPCVIAGLDEPHGLTIKGVLDEYYGDEVHHGQLYPNLNTLVDKELVKKGEIDKRTNSYPLADRGEHEIKARHEWEDEHVALEA